MEEHVYESTEIAPIESFETLDDARWADNSFKSEIDASESEQVFFKSLDNEVTMPSDEIQKPWAEFDDLANNVNPKSPFD